MVQSWIAPVTHGSWEFRVEIHPDPDSGRPEECKPDVYDPARRATSEQVREAQEIVATWERREWGFVEVSVTPVLKLSDGRQVEFTAATERMGDVEWGRFPSGDPAMPEQGREEINRYPVPDLIASAVGEAERLRSLVAQIPPLEPEDRSDHS